MKTLDRKGRKMIKDTHKDRIKLSLAEYVLQGSRTVESVCLGDADGTHLHTDYAAFIVGWPGNYCAVLGSSKTIMKPR